MRLNTFGRVFVARDGGEEVALQPLALAVLVYLTVGGPRNRDHLADLFWHNSKNSLNSLSTTLNRIRAEVPDGIWIQGNSLVGVNLASDVGELREAMHTSDLASVVELYDAPFLGSLKLRGRSIEFEEWVLEERSSLAASVEVVLLQEGRDLYVAGDHSAAAAPVEAAWEIAVRDGFPSPDYFPTYHQILASAARPAAAAVRSMADELGIVLEPVELVSLEPPSNVTTSMQGSEPAAGDERGNSGATPLFGCEDELAAIASAVAGQRLTTIVGLGGSGKTRLAAEFFNSVGREFVHRHWVDLRDVAHEDLVASAIAASFGQRLDDAAVLAERLPEDESVLLVLDNFEHVLGAASVVEQLVRGNSMIRILVTSRVPLEAAAESLVQLNGLDTEDADVDDDQAASPAEQLFRSSARRAGVNDERLSSFSRTAVLEVCRRVGGNPLALEIAGGWAPILSPHEILDVLSVDNELLGTPMGSDLRSMDAVLHQSWSTMDEAEQHSLMLLATFPSGCLTSEALKLPGLSIRSVGRLVQHSLARLQNEGRITLHPLIAGHALVELEQRPDLRREIHRIRSEWCQNFAAALSDASGRHPHSFDAEVANFTAAWLSDASDGLWDLHQATLPLLRQFFNDSGRIREGRSLFEAVVHQVRSDPDGPEGVLSAALEALGWFEVLSGELVPARKRLGEALTLSSEDDPHAQAQILRSLGDLQLIAGEADEATATLEAALALIADDPGPLTASLQYDLAQAHHYRGDRDQAASAARLALQAGRQANNWTVMTTSYLLLADVAVESDPERAIVLLNEGWEIAKDAALDNLTIYFPSILGLAHLKLHDAESAERSFSEGIDAADKVGQLTTVCANHIGRAEARLLTGRTGDAIEDLRTGIRLALKTDSGRYLMWAAVVSCRAAAVQHAPGTLMKELLLLTLRHPATDQVAQDKATETLRELFDLEPEPRPVEPSDSVELALDEVAERALQLLTVR